MTAAPRPTPAPASQTSCTLCAYAHKLHTSASGPMHAIVKKAVAFGYGVVCHALFAVAIAFAVWGLYTGLQSGRGVLHGRAALLVNFALLVQFPVLHSFLLSTRGRRILGRLAPLGLGRDLSTTTYAIVAAAQLLAVFALWSPSGVVLWEPRGALRAVFGAMFAASWLVLAKTLHDAGLPVQTGFLGWSSVVRGCKPAYGPMATRGAFRYCRQPVYIGFSLTLWTGPVFTPEKLVLAALWTAYCLVGPLFKEARYLRFYGDAFRAYKARVPYWWPFGRRLKKTGDSLHIIFQQNELAGNRSATGHRARHLSQTVSAV